MKIITMEQFNEYATAHGISWHFTKPKFSTKPFDADEYNKEHKSEFRKHYEAIGEIWNEQCLRLKDNDLL